MPERDLPNPSSVARSYLLEIGYLAVQAFVAFHVLVFVSYFSNAELGPIPFIDLSNTFERLTKRLPNFLRAPAPYGLIVATPLWLLGYWLSYSWTFEKLGRGRVARSGPRPEGSSILAILAHHYSTHVLLVSFIGLVVGLKYVR